MAAVVVDDSSLLAVANAIRAKGYTSEQLTFPNGFISAIAGLAADDYKIFSGSITVSPASSTITISDVTFTPVGIAIFHTRPGNMTYYVSGEKTLLFGVGTTANTGTKTMSWNSILNGGSKNGTCDLWITQNDTELILTLGGVFNGPYQYLIWGQ